MRDLGLELLLSSAVEDGLRGAALVNREGATIARVGEIAEGAPMALVAHDRSRASAPTCPALGRRLRRQPEIRQPEI